MAEENQKPAMHFAEDEHTEKILDWWKKNGTAIIVGLVIGVGSVGGYQGWNIYQDRQGEAASDLYQNMLRSLATETLVIARENANQVVTNYGATAYADGAYLVLAKLEFEAGELDQADEHLTRVMNKSKDLAMQHVARLRRITIALHRDDLDLVDDLLKVDEKIGFEARYYELRGDASVARKDVDSAREAYTSALELAVTGSVSAQILERKLNSVSVLDGLR